jgi:hypothetical protein
MEGFLIHDLKRTKRSIDINWMELSFILQLRQIGLSYSVKRNGHQ